MSFEAGVIQAIRRIPQGNVATYGQIAGMAGSPRAAIIVGQILRNRSSKDELPWQRVINSRGQISIVNMEYPAELQASLLQEEGIAVEERDRSYWIDLKKYLWQPDKID